MNRSIATALFAVAAAVAGQAYAAPDAYSPNNTATGPARARAEVAVEAVQAARLNGQIVGVDTLVRTQAAPTAFSVDRNVIRLEALQANNAHSDVLASPQ